MKTLKFITFLLCLSTWLWIGCSDDGEKEMTEPATLELSGDLTLDWQGTPGEVMVTTNRASWVAVVDKDAEEWCQFTPKRDRLVITPNVNPNAEPRVATVTVTVENLTKTVKVIQEQIGEIILSADPESLTFVWQGERKELTVTTNMKSWAATSDQTWCRLEQSGNKLTVTADQNPTRQNRPATITFTAGTKTLPVSVLQQKKESAVVGMSIAFDIETEFAGSSVYDVWNGDQKVAEICYEYIPQLNAAGRTTVVYPTDESGRTDLVNGFVVADGGSIIWDKNTNSYTYLRGELTTPATRLYVNDHALYTESSESAPGTVLPLLFKDAENYEYPLVKIGTQYWLGENLRTKINGDGSAIGQDFSGTVGAWGLYEDRSSSVREECGLLYNWYALGQIAPAGYHVPLIEEWEKLAAYLGAEDAQLLKSTESWLDEGGNGTNYSGFTVYPGGSRWYTVSGKYTMGGYRGDFWSATAVVNKEEGKGIGMTRDAKSEWTESGKNIGLSVRLLMD